MNFEDFITTISILIVAVIVAVFAVFGFALCCHAEEINMQALATIESSNGLHQDSFLGSKYGRGLYQVSEVLLSDYNRLNGCNIRPQDLYDDAVNEIVADWALYNYIPKQLTHYGCEVTEKAVLQAYNLGPKAYANGKRNLNYLAKYYEASKQIERSV